MQNTSVNNAPHIVCVLWELDCFLRNSAILKSQALGQMKYLLKLGARITILCSDPEPNDFMNSFGAKLNSVGFRVIPIATKGYRNFLSLHHFRKQLSKLERKDPIDFIYIRNFWNILTVPDKQIKVIFDLRGANLEETAFNSINSQSLKTRLKSKVYAYFERKAVARANYLQCVSQPLKKYISERFGRNDVIVVNSCVERERFYQCRQKRELIREKLGIQRDEIVFTFLGGLAQYQEINFMISLWAKLAHMYQRAFFMFLTSDKNHTNVKDMLFKAGIPCERLVVKSVSYDDVPRYCAAGDFGFLLRQHIILNHVASPVKFSEYMAAGLGVITSPRIGDVSDCVVKNNIGCLVIENNGDSSIKHIRNLIENFDRDRELFLTRVQQVAREKFTWDSYREYYQERYFHKKPR